MRSEFQRNTLLCKRIVISTKVNYTLKSMLKVINNVILRKGKFKEKFIT